MTVNHWVPGSSPGHGAKCFKRLGGFVGTFKDLVSYYQKLKADKAALFRWGDVLEYGF